MNLFLPKPSRVCFTAAFLLSLTACQLPPRGDVSGHATVRRAEPAGQTRLYAGAESLNVPIQASSINHVARMLAGMEAYGGQSSFAQVRDSSAWPAHQQEMDRLWRSHENGRGASVRQWAVSEISDLQRHRALFYPFSGPDFLFAHQLFPFCETYILCGLESAEPLPDLTTLSPEEVSYGLSGLRASLTSLMQAGYFVTQDMRSEFQATRFRGVLPVLLALLVRTGNTVESVDIVGIDGMGNPVMSGTGRSGAPGLMIRFRSGFGQSKRLFYFRQDLSNSGLRPGGPFLTFVSKQGYPPALVKSASYLMHEGSFSTIRNYLIHACAGIVQDPSGVPFRDLVSSGASIRLYGNYTGTLGIFSSQQPDLLAAYQSRQYPVMPVNFGFGYLYYPSTTSIIVARRR